MTFRRALTHLKEKGLGHWLWAVLLIGAGVLIGKWLGERQVWTSLRYQIYQMQQALAPRVLRPKRTALVLIGDEEYWGPELSRRVPINRSYLARLVRQLDLAETAVIALDFDLRVTNPAKETCEYSAYESETRDLASAVKEVSNRRPVVLPRTLAAWQEVGYTVDRIVLDCFDVGRGSLSDGYISLPSDIRQVPTPQPIVAHPGARGRRTLDSFAVAIVRSVDDKALRDLDDDVLPYGTFIEPSDFEKYPSSKILGASTEELREWLSHDVVLIGGAWHSRGPGRGEGIDVYPSPVGRVPGVFLHANYVETLLDSRLYDPLPEEVGTGVEVFLAMVIAVLFALPFRPLIQLVVVFSACAMVVVMTYVAWQNLGLFFDLFIPVLLLAGHALVENVSSWRKDALEWRRVR